MKVLATYSIKGGVGKTSTAVNLANEASLSGARVLLWDLDPQAAATFLLRAEPKLRGGAKQLVRHRRSLQRNVQGTALPSAELPSVDLVPAALSLRHLDLRLAATGHPLRRLGVLLEPLVDDYDVAILDCPPSLSLLSESVFATSDALLVPTVPTPLATRTLTQLAGLLAGCAHPPELLPFLSMVERRKRLQCENVAALRAEWPQLLRTVVPNASVIEQMSQERQPVAAFAPRSVAALAFRELWNEIVERLWV